jgi:hypothetical protein
MFISIWFRKKYPHSSALVVIISVVLALLAVVLIARTERVAADPTPQLSFNPSAASLLVGNSTVVTITLASVTNLYGYQLQVGYDTSRVSAVGAFVNGFFDTSVDAFSPSGWNANCAAGLCNFAVTKLRPATDVTGSGPLARITFTGIAPGSVTLTYLQSILGDRNGMAIAHTTSTGALTVNGTATITGTVKLQGRTTPITAGTVTLTDTAGIFTPTIVSFDATTGQFTATVPVEPGGSTYNLLAAHSLYLSNRRTGVAVAHASIVNVGTTTLKGGDANNDGKINIFDLSCIGGAYDGPPKVCGTTGNSDITGNGVVNIFDLAITGGNYDLVAPQPW